MDLPEIQEFAQGGWNFLSRSGKMMPSATLDALQSELKLNHIPEVTFSNNIMQMSNIKKGIVYYISAVDALKYCNYEYLNKHLETYENATSTTDNRSVNYKPEVLKVKAADFWNKGKKVPDDIEVEDMNVTSDWTFTTPYKGSLTGKKNFVNMFMNHTLNDTINEDFTIIKTDETIPAEKLGQDNLIMFYTEVLLWQDDLGDFGMGQLKIRFRAMKDCAFGLLRYYLRNDNAQIRICDTRIFIDYEKDYILRDFSVRENTYTELREKGFLFTPEFNLAQNQDDLVYPTMTVK